MNWGQRKIRDREGRVTLLSWNIEGWDFARRRMNRGIEEDNILIRLRHSNMKLAGLESWRMLPSSY